MTTRATTAVVMARGLGTRMRKESAGTELSESQRRAAAHGLKAMIPDDAGRPFLDHILSGFADAGVRDVILVVAPDHAMIRDHYRASPPVRVSLTYAVQDVPTGTANALLATESLVAGRDFLVSNGDNLYPREAIEALVNLEGPGVAAFDREALVEGSNIDASRIASFALLDIDGANHLRGIIEKPGEDHATQQHATWIGMNLWRFDAQIFEACRDVPKSARGEYELPEAVGLAVSRGMTITAVPVHAGVLDLSSRGDIGTVSAQLGRATITP